MSPPPPVEPRLLFQPGPGLKSFGSQATVWAQFQLLFFGAASAGCASLFWLGGRALTLGAPPALLQAGANRSLPDEDGHNPLHYARNTLKMYVDKPNPALKKLGFRITPPKPPNAEKSWSC